MKIFKMIRGFFLKRSLSYKIMQNVIFHVKLLSPTLNGICVSLSDCERYSTSQTFGDRSICFKVRLTELFISLTSL